MMTDEEPRTFQWWWVVMPVLIVILLVAILTPLAIIIVRLIRGKSDKSGESSQKETEML